MTDGERLGDEGVRLGPIQWAVVTKYLVPSGLFVRLEDSGEKAFMDMVSVDDHSVCCNPEYWPDAGEHIRVRRLLVPGLNEIRVTRRESALEGLVRGFPTRHFAMPPGLGSIERAVVVAHREGDLLVRLVESGRVCTLLAAFISDDPAECAKKNWPAVGERIRVRRLGVWPGGEMRVSRTMFTHRPVTPPRRRGSSRAETIGPPSRRSPIRGPCRRRWWAGCGRWPTPSRRGTGTGRPNSPAAIAWAGRMSTTS